MDVRTRRNTIAFSLLGPVRAWHGTSELDLGSPQQRTTLAALLLREGRTATLDELIAGMWGDDAPRSAATTIRTYVSRLRRVLDEAGGSPDVQIDSAGGGYVLRLPVGAVDISVFRRHTSNATEDARRGDYASVAAQLGAALDLPGGPPLAGTVGPYALAQGVRLQQMITTAELELLSAQVSMGQYQQALPELTTMLAEHPLWEQVHELVMTALYGSGRAAEALDHYQSVRRSFIEDLGIEPGAHMRELQHRILLREPAPVAATASRPRRSVRRRRRIRVTHGQLLRRSSRS